MTTETQIYQTVKVEKEGGIGLVVLNRPEKRNAINPTLHQEMVQVPDELADAPEVLVLVLTGAGDSWCAGQDLREFFRTLDDKPSERRRATKEVYKTCKTMDYWQAEEYMAAKATALRATDPERGREKGIKQFVDEKRYRPSFGAYIRNDE